MVKTTFSDAILARPASSRFALQLGEKDSRRRARGHSFTRRRPNAAVAASPSNSATEIARRRGPRELERRRARISALRPPARPLGGVPTTAHTGLREQGPRLPRLARCRVAAPPFSAWPRSSAASSPRDRRLAGARRVERGRAHTARASATRRNHPPPRAARPATVPTRIDVLRRKPCVAHQSLAPCSSERNGSCRPRGDHSPPARELRGDGMPPRTPRAIDCTASARRCLLGFDHRSSPQGPSIARVHEQDPLGCGRGNGVRLRGDSPATRSTPRIRDDEAAVSRSETGLPVSKSGRQDQSVRSSRCVRCRRRPRRGSAVTRLRPLRHHVAGSGGQQCPTPVTRSCIGVSRREPRREPFPACARVRTDEIVCRSWLTARTTGRGGGDVSRGDVDQPRGCRRRPALPALPTGGSARLLALEVTAPFAAHSGRTRRPLVGKVKPHLSMSRTRRFVGHRHARERTCSAVMAGWASSSILPRAGGIEVGAGRGSPGYARRRQGDTEGVVPQSLP